MDPITAALGAAQLQPVPAFPEDGGALVVRLGHGEALPALTRLQEASPRTGSWPLIVDGLTVDRLEDIYRCATFPRGPSAVLSAAAMDVDAVVLELERQVVGDAAEAWETDADPDDSAWEGDLPSVDDLMACAAKAVTTVPEAWEPEQTFPEASLLLVPVTEPWQVVPWLGFGGYNQCPPPEDLGALLRRWEERHDVVPVGVGSDRLVIQVRQPPSESREAAALVRELLLACPDILELGGAQAVTSLLDVIRVPETVVQLWWD